MSILLLLLCFLSLSLLLSFCGHSRASLGYPSVSGLCHSKEESLYICFVESDKTAAAAVVVGLMGLSVEWCCSRVISVEAL